MLINEKNIIPSGSFTIENEMGQIKQRPDVWQYLFFVVIPARYALQ
jgi:hypothetical protein